MAITEIVRGCCLGSLIYLFLVRMPSNAAHGSGAAATPMPQISNASQASVRIQKLLSKHTHTHTHTHTHCRYVHASRSSLSSGVGKVQVRLPLGVVPTITAEAAVAQVRAAVGRQFVLLEPDATARAIAIAFTSFQIECVLCARSLQTLFKCQKLF